MKSSSATDSAKFAASAVRAGLVAAVAAEMAAAVPPAARGYRGHSPEHTRRRSRSIVSIELISMRLGPLAGGGWPYLSLNTKLLGSRASPGQPLVARGSYLWWFLVPREWPSWAIPCLDLREEERSGPVRMGLLWALLLCLGGFGPARNA